MLHLSESFKWLKTQSHTWKSSLTMRAPSPTYFCTSSLPMTRMKQASVLLATARASSVFPVPAQREASRVMVTQCAGSPCMALCQAGPGRTPARLRAGRLVTQHHAMTSISPESLKPTRAPVPCCTRHGMAQADGLAKLSV